MLNAQDRNTLNQVASLLSLFRTPEKISAIVTAAQESVSQLNEATKKYETVQKAEQMIAQLQEDRARMMVEAATRTKELDIQSTKIALAQNAAEEKSTAAALLMQEAQKQSAAAKEELAKVAQEVVTQRAALSARAEELDKSWQDLNAREAALKARSAQIAALATQGA